MALEMIGSAPCPYCKAETEVGLSRGGEGNALHLICGPCPTFRLVAGEWQGAGVGEGRAGGARLPRPSQTASSKPEPKLEGRLWNFPD